jgi:N-acetyl-anhydromuramyl-L-alanine amidase AmpD
LRKVPADVVVLHWTGGEGGHDQIHRTLRKRGLCIHFTCAQDGSIVQHAGIDAVTSHAGKTMNARSVGIEIANAGFPPGNAKWPRQVIPAHIHDRTIRTLAFYEAQTTAVLRLTRALCDGLRVPFAVPRGESGEVVAGKLSAVQRDAWRGVLGHLHISGEKCDPGLALLDAVR